MPIICFFGPDGSGKTSLANRLAPALAQRGYRVKVSWMRGTHTLSFILARLLARCEIFKGDNPSRISIPSGLQTIWGFIEFLSMIPVLLLRFVIPDALGFWVVAERYTPDFIVLASITTNNRMHMEVIRSKFLLSLAKKARVRIYVTADIDELYRRSHENVQFLSRQLSLYGALTKALDTHILDTTHRSLEDSFQEIKSLTGL